MRSGRRSSQLHGRWPPDATGRAVGSQGSQTTPLLRDVPNPARCFLLGDCLIRPEEIAAAHSANNLWGEWHWSRPGHLQLLPE
eukprot:8699170-Lingulodinium_polyedra.AAC.1